MTDKQCRARMTEDLHSIGVNPGGILMVHSSFKSLGPVPGGIDTVIGGMVDALGPEGTLLMPALSWTEVSPGHPCFDVRNTASCVGAIPEYFRGMPGTLRSMHPTHSACGQGRQAAVLLGNHALDWTPCGAHSPFTLLRQYGGQVLMLGCGLLHNTLLHAVEEASDAPYLFLEEPVMYSMTGYDGQTYQTVHRRHADFAQHFDRVRPGLLGRGLTEGQVLEAPCGLFDAEALWNHATEMMHADIYCFNKD